MSMHLRRALQILTVVFLGTTVFLIAQQTQAADDFDGWVWAGSSTDGTDASGYFSLSCDNADYQPPHCADSNYGMVLNVANGNISGELWLGQTETTAQQAIGWLSFNPDQTGEPPVNGSHGYPSWIAKWDSATGDVQGWGRILRIAEEGTRLGFDDWGWVRFDHGKSDEVNINPDDQTMTGYAWSGGGTTGQGYDENVGLGWLDFNGAGLALTLPFFATESGDIYARVSIGSPQDAPPLPQTGYYTAQYLIQSSGAIVNVASNPSMTDPLDDFSGVIGFPQRANAFRNVLGALPELSEWTTVVDSATGKNKFGEIYVDFTRNSLAGNFSMEQKGDQVLVHSGDLLIPPAGVQIQNATSKRGSSVIVVTGDLTIEGEIAYDVPANIPEAKNLASIVWVVYGDVIVDPDVERMDGVFVVLENDASGGTFRTGTVGGDPGSDEQLLVNGMVMAKQFELERNATDNAGAAIPAERFILDSRFFLNTPESLRDFASAIPQVTDVAR